MRIAHLEDVRTADQLDGGDYVATDRGESTTARSTLAELATKLLALVSTAVGRAILAATTTAQQRSAIGIVSMHDCYVANLTGNITLAAATAGTAPADLAKPVLQLTPDASGREVALPSGSSDAYKSRLFINPSAAGGYAYRIMWNSALICELPPAGRLSLLWDGTTWI